MAQTLGMYQAMAKEVVALKDMGRLIYARRELIDQKREHYEDVSLRNGLYELIRLINRTIGELNLGTIDRHITAVRVDLILANSMVTAPPLEFSAQIIAARVARLALHASTTVVQLGNDRHLSPLLVQRKGQIDRLKTDIDSMSRTTLIVAAIKERQQLLRAREEERHQQIAAEAILRLEQQRQKTKTHASELAKAHSQFDLAINCSALDHARHALWVIEQAPIDVQVCLFNGQDVSMKLARMHQQCESLRREVYGRHGIRNLDAITPTAAIS